MVLIKEIELELSKENKNVPEAVEDTLIKDSIIDLANTDFSKLDEVEDVAVGEIRKKIIVDTGYSGKPISRKQFSGNDWLEDLKTKLAHDETESTKYDSDDSPQSSGFDSDEDKGDSSNEFSASEKYEPLKKSENMFDSECEEASEVEDSEDDVEEDFGDELDLAKYEKVVDTQRGNIDIFSAKTKDTDAEVAKGVSVRNQLSIWESLLEGRIKLQTSLISANKLYQKEDFSNFRSTLKPEDESVLSNAYSSLGKLMKTLLELQEVLLNSSREYLDLRNNKEPNDEIDKEISDDESISSSLASGKEEPTSKEDELKIKNSSTIDEPRSKKIKLGNYSDHLEDLYSDFKPFKDKTIQTWNDKTRITSGKISSSDFSAFDQPTLKQIEQILLDKSRLIRKTQLKRSDYEILGKQQQPEILPKDDSISENQKNQKEYDGEIFDDDDFYHKLLRDLIARKSTDATDTNKHGRQWLEIQHLRSKMKRKVDTRCTKGRKLRYTVHNKLVNFMAPIPCNIWNEEAENQLFKSLFGKTAV